MENFMKFSQLEIFTESLMIKLSTNPQVWTGTTLNYYSILST